MPPSSSRALERLKKAANLVPVKRIVTLCSGEEFVFWSMLSMLTGEGNVTEAEAKN